MRVKPPVFATILIVSVAVSAQNRPSGSAMDPAFATIAFDRWIGEHDQPRFQWSAQFSSGELAKSQRLEVRLDIQIDGNELVKRRGRGELALFIQLTDSDRRVFQTHGAVQLRDVTEAAGKSNIIFTQTALAVPGNYGVDIAILDTNTGEHATMQRSLRVAPLKNDPLPDSWQGLPAVEFTQGADPPDTWFQPYMNGQLHLPIENSRPVHVDVLLNATPSTIEGRFRGGQTTTVKQNLQDLLPELKVLSQLHLSKGTLSASLIDLSRRAVLFTQDQVDLQNQPLDWPRLRPALLEADPNKIDVHQLEEHRQNPQFFVEQVRRRVVSEAVQLSDDRQSLLASLGARSSFLADL